MMMGIPNGRLPYEQLFYDGNAKKQITKNDLNSKEYPLYMKDLLTALRSGPSAINQSTMEIHFNRKRSSYF